jgi:hypothetical protein
MKGKNFIPCIAALAFLTACSGAGNASSAPTTPQVSKGQIFGPAPTVLAFNASTVVEDVVAAGAGGCTPPPWVPNSATIPPGGRVTFSAPPPTSPEASNCSEGSLTATASTGGDECELQWVGGLILLANISADCNWTPSNDTWTYQLSPPSARKR